jgi:putative membrane protein
MNSKQLKSEAGKLYLQPHGEKPDANALAEQRTELALQRSFQATERTLMAWVRTAISMISFGFTMVKFFEYLEEDKHKQFHFLGPAGVGMILILIGILALIVAVIQHRRVVTELGGTRRSERWSLSVLVAISVVFLGVFALMAVRSSY